VIFHQHGIAAGVVARSARDGGLTTALVAVHLVVIGPCSKSVRRRLAGRFRETRSGTSAPRKAAGRRLVSASTHILNLGAPAASDMTTSEDTLSIVHNEAR